MSNKDNIEPIKPTLIRGGKSDPKLTPKQRAFVDNIVKGKIGTYKECYAKAYDVTLTKTGAIPKWCEVEASKLMADPKIALSIQSAIEKKDRSTLASSLRTREYVLEALLRESKEAESDASRIRSLELIGKTIGLFTDQIEVKSHRSVEEIDRDLEEKIQALVASESS